MLKSLPSIKTFYKSFHWRFKKFLKEACRHCSNPPRPWGPCPSPHLPTKLADKAGVFFLFLKPSASFQPSCLGQRSECVSVAVLSLPSHTGRLHLDMPLQLAPSSRLTPPAHPPTILPALARLSSVSPRGCGATSSMCPCRAGPPHPQWV